MKEYRVEIVYSNMLQDKLNEFYDGGYELFYIEKTTIHSHVNSIVNGYKLILKARDI